MENLNTWWKHVPGERFWIGVARQYEGKGVLATPCGFGPHASGNHALVRHVANGDTVFLFDRDQEAIVACSAARGGVRKRQLVWSHPGHETSAGPAAPERLASWTLELRPPIALDTPVSLGQIARLQSEQFLALRALEDVVGAPLLYPFELGSPDETHLLAGQVFKLPALFVEACPALAQAASRPSGVQRQARVPSSKIVLAPG